MFGTGGDEINVKCYENDEQTQEDLKKSGKTLEQALDAFTSRTHEALKRLGKKVVVWQGRVPFTAYCGSTGTHYFFIVYTEMALDHQVTLANDTIITYVLLRLLLKQNRN